MEPFRGLLSVPFRLSSLECFLQILPPQDQKLLRAPPHVRLYIKQPRRAILGPRKAHCGQTAIHVVGQDGLSPFHFPADLCLLLFCRPPLLRGSQVLRRHRFELGRCGRLLEFFLPFRHMPLAVVEVCQLLFERIERVRFSLEPPPEGKQVVSRAILQFSLYTIFTISGRTVVLNPYMSSRVGLLLVDSKCPNPCQTVFHLGQEATDNGTQPLADGEEIPLSFGRSGQRPEQVRGPGSVSGVELAGAEEVL